MELASFCFRTRTFNNPDAPKKIEQEFPVPGMLRYASDRNIRSRDNIHHSYYENTKQCSRRKGWGTYFQCQTRFVHHQVPCLSRNPQLALPPCLSCTKSSSEASFCSSRAFVCTSSDVRNRHSKCQCPCRIPPRSREHGTELSGTPLLLSRRTSPGSCQTVVRVTLRVTSSGL